MEVSPFPHQGPLEPAQVKGREALIADLTERLTARRVTALVGPRRYGKTSVLRRVATDLTNAGTSVVWADLYEVTSTADLARRFDTALADAHGPVRSALDAIAPRLNLSLGLLGVEFIRRRDERPDPEAALDTLLDALVAGARNTPTVIVVDEFPGIDRVEGAAGLLRTKLQHHFQEIALVFAGSEPSLMRTMFADRARPFYAQADLVEIRAFDQAAVQEIVSEGFRSTDRDPGDLPTLIHRFTSGHPYRAMQVADAAWRSVTPRQPFRDSTWGHALETLRAETSLATEAVFGAFGTGEKAVLRLLAHKDALFGAAAELLGTSSGSAQHARDSLIASGDLALAEGRLAVVDPVLADWVRRRFPR